MKLKQLYDACHDYGSVVSGRFPTWYAVRRARKEGRLIAQDNNTHGYIKIIGRDQCHVTFRTYL